MGNSHVPFAGRVATGTGSDFSQEAHRRTLFQPHDVHVARNSATITTAVISHVDGLTYGALNPLLLICMKVVVIAAIVADRVADRVFRDRTVQGPGSVVGRFSRGVGQRGGRLAIDTGIAMCEPVPEGRDRVPDQRAVSPGPARPNA